MATMPITEVADETLRVAQHYFKYNENPNSEKYGIREDGDYIEIWWVHPNYNCGSEEIPTVSPRSYKISENGLKKEMERRGITES